MRKLFGKILIENDIITLQQLETALTQQQITGKRLASQVLDLGFADEISLARALSRQQGFPCVVFSRSIIPLEICKTIPVHEAYRLRVIPVARNKRSLIVAFADPDDNHQVDEARFISGERVIEHGALLDPLQNAIDNVYKLRANTDQGFLRGDRVDPNLDPPENGIAEIVYIEEGDDSTSTQSDLDLLPDMDIVLTERSPVKTHQPDERLDGKTIPVILVVDDDESLRHMLRKYLTKSGFRVREAADGREALSQLKSSLPDAILLDAMLPGIHGFNICRLIKTAKSTRHIPVIMITAIYRSEEYKDKARLLYGANAYIEKPLKINHLKVVLDNCLASRSHPFSQKDVSSMAAKLLKSTDLAIKQGDLRTAAQHLEQFINLSPFYPSLHCKLASIYERLGDKYRSLSHFEQAAQLESSYSILYHLAKSYEKMGFFRKAIKAWEKCVLSCEKPRDAEIIRHHLEKLLD